MSYIHHSPSTGQIGCRKEHLHSDQKHRISSRRKLSSLVCVGCGPFGYIAERSNTRHTSDWSNAGCITGSEGFLRYSDDMEFQAAEKPFEVYFRMGKVALQGSEFEAVFSNCASPVADQPSTTATFSSVQGLFLAYSFTRMSIQEAPDSRQSPN